MTVQGPRCAVGIPNIGEYADPRVVRELAVLAEQNHWDGLFLWDHPTYRGDQAETDPQVAVATAATATERIRLGICVVQLGRRRPAKVAREIASLDVLSGGRIVLGVGLGSYPGDFSMFGDDPDPRVRGRKTDEGLEVLNGLWSGQRFDYAGEYFRRAARWDGTFPIFRDVPGDANVPPDLLAEAVSFVRRHRASDAGPFDVVLEGATPGAPPLAEYVDAGLTWWVEKLGWWRGDLEATRRRILQGPPTL